VFGVLVIASFVAPIIEQLPLDPPDTTLHLVSAAVAAYLGFAARSQATSRM
jgi:hypothetical protein